MRALVWCVAGLAAAIAMADPASAQTAPPAPRGQVQYSPPPATEPAQPQASLSTAEIRELLNAMRETAKATRESVDYSRVVPDILQQMLAKLDKLEMKLDKIENAVKAQGGASRKR